MTDNWRVIEQREAGSVCMEYDEMMSRERVRIRHTTSGWIEHKIFHLWKTCITIRTDAGEVEQYIGGYRRSAKEAYADAACVVREAFLHRLERWEVVTYRTTMYVRQLERDVKAPIICFGSFGEAEHTPAYGGWDLH